MLIERMHTNPEDFEYGGKLHNIASERDLSERDRAAILRADEELIKEPKLMERVITALLAQPEQEETQYKMYGQARMSINSNGQLGIGAISSNAAQGLYTTGFSDPRLAHGSPGFSAQELRVAAAQQKNALMQVRSQNGEAQLQLGQQSLTENMIKTLKQKMGL